MEPLEHGNDEGGYLGLSIVESSVEARQTGQAGDRARRSSGTELVCRLREYDFRNVNHDVYDRIWHSRAR